MPADPLMAPVAEQTDLWKLAQMIDREGPPVHGLDPRLVADVLEVSLVDTWRTADNGSFIGPYRPFTVIQGEDGITRRSFVVDDLKPEHEDALRQFAEASSNAFVRARIFDVLWVRYRNHTFAHEAALRLPAPLGALLRVVRLALASLGARADMVNCVMRIAADETVTFEDAPAP